MDEDLNDDFNDRMFGLKKCDPYCWLLYRADVYNGFTIQHSYIICIHIHTRSHVWSCLLVHTEYTVKKLNK